MAYDLQSGTSTTLLRQAPGDTGELTRHRWLTASGQELCCAYTLASLSVGPANRAVVRMSQYEGFTLASVTTNGSDVFKQRLELKLARTVRLGTPTATGWRVVRKRTQRRASLSFLRVNCASHGSWRKTSRRRRSDLERRPGRQTATGSPQHAGRRATQRCQTADACQCRRRGSFRPCI